MKLPNARDRSGFGTDETDVELGVVSNVAALPTNAVLLIRAEVTAGTSPGVKTVQARTAVPSAGQASLN